MKKIILPVIVTLLLATNALTGYLLFKVQNEKIINPYPLVDFSRSFIPQEHFIINLVPLKKELGKVVSEYQDATVSAYIEFLNTGANININRETTIWPASLIKLPVVLAAAKKVEEGVWSWDNELVLYDEDKDQGFGKLYLQESGTRLTIDELVKEILINSDNTANKILVRNIENSYISAIGEEIGIDNFADENNKIRIKDYARIFRTLYVSSFLKRETSQKILGYLSQSNLKEYLAQGLPEKSVFAHKLARNRKQLVFGDMGIVYIPNRPYLIGVMVEVANPQDEQQASELMQKISSLSYGYFLNHD